MSAPIGASSARPHHAAHELQRQGKSKGFVTLAIGGGVGIAVCVER